jgi:hypothetical protein
MNGDDAIPEEDINWSRSFFNKINIGGMWSVPRSGLTFHKVSDKLFALANVAPSVPGTPPDKERLREFQREDYKLISLRFEAAGINVIDPTHLLDKRNLKEQTSIMKLGEGGKSASNYTVRPFCSICGEIYEGVGHNAYPVNAGRCCVECNMNVVLPRRAGR